MERRLAQHPAVARVALTVLDRGERQAVAAAIVLTPAGAAELEPSGSLALQAALRRYLSAYFDPVLAPRAFHFADGLPTDAQGKVTSVELARLFTTID
jgi:acyl-coenzyme A synthetase/AMP-(fatty) acid ligase